MKTRRMVTAAMVLALAISAVIVMTASAAGASASTKITLKPQQHKLISLGKTRFSPTAKAPARSTTKDVNLNVDRPIPGKAIKTLGPNGGGGGIPTVPPQNVATLPAGHLKATRGLNAFDTWQVEGQVFQPPDQGLCAGNGFVFEMVNDAVAVYDSNMNKLTADMSLGPFFGIPIDAGGGDPKCYFDPDSKQWFATQIAYGAAVGPQGPKAVPFDIFVLVAVSMTQDPRLGWNVYALDVTFDCPDPEEFAPCLGDQPLIGANRDAFFISTNDYSYFLNGYWGTNLYVFDKTALVAGSLGSLVNVAYIPVGQKLETPDGECTGTVNTCWYTLQPAFTGDKGNWDNRHGGIEYFLSALDFFGAGDTRVALWALDNTQSIHANPGSWSFDIHETTLNSEMYITPLDFSPQKNDGLIPFGKVYFGATKAGPIQPNDDRMQQVYQGPTHVLWGGINTGLNEPFPRSGGAGQVLEYHNGIAYWGVRPSWNMAGDLLGNILTQGYVAPRHEDVVFPSIAVTQLGRGAMTFSLTSGKRYPSAAYTMVNMAGHSDIFVSNAGMSSYDGSCEYNPACGDSFGSGLRPRWGDYSAAVLMNGRIYMATEYIQTRDCDETAYLDEGPFPTCGDTRSWRQNWGTALQRVSP